MNLDIIKQFKLIYGFRREVTKDDYTLYFNSENVKDPKSFIWLYISYEQEMKLVGIKEDIVYAIDTNGYLIEICEGVQNVPYEYLRMQSNYAADELVENIFNDNAKYYKELLSFEQWCKDNNIELDKNKVYHDENGGLFTKYFDKE